MARYYRRRYRTIVRAPKKKWASNIKQITETPVGDGAKQFSITTLVENSTQTSTPTPVIVKTGNFKVQGDLIASFSSSPANASFSLYVVYKPEGISIIDYTSAKNLIDSHPEWIMAWKYLSSNLALSTSENGDSFTFSSRLKRNLNSGDSVCLISLVTGTNMTTSNINGMVQYWTCAN